MQFMLTQRFLIRAFSIVWLLYGSVLIIASIAMPLFYGDMEGMTISPLALFSFGLVVVVAASIIRKSKTACTVLQFCAAIIAYRSISTFVADAGATGKFWSSATGCSLICSLIVMSIGTLQWIKRTIIPHIIPQDM